MSLRLSNTTKSRWLWLCCALPWITGGALLAAFSADAYRDGRTFAVGMHVFKWFYHLYLGAFAYGAAVFVAGVAIVVGQRRLRQRKQLDRAFLLVATSVFLPLVAFGVISSYFEKGRQAAYENLNVAPIHAACVELTDRVRRAGEPFGCTSLDGNCAGHLPAALDAMSPLEVHATEAVVLIQLDGGGAVMYDEGIAVFPHHTTADAPAPQALQPLSDSLAVFQYRVDDCRSILDHVRTNLGDPLPVAPTQQNGTHP